MQHVRETDTARADAPRSRLTLLPAALPPDLADLVDSRRVGLVVDGGVAVLIGTVQGSAEGARLTAAVARLEGILAVESFLRLGAPEKSLRSRFGSPSRREPSPQRTSRGASPLRS